MKTKVKMERLSFQVPKELYEIIEKIALKKGFAKIQQFVRPKLLELLDKVVEESKEK